MGVHRLIGLAAVSCTLALACGDVPSEHVGVVRAAIRPSPGATTDAPRFEPNDKVEILDSDSGFFRVHYTRAGQNAVPRTDRDGDGLPDYVTSVAKNFDEVLSFYRERGFREPVRDGELPGDHGGDDRFDVYLLDFPTSADGEYRPDDACAEATSCSGYMLLENDFDGRGYPSLTYAVRLVASHELFHAVQHAYVVETSGILNEGTAVWASEAFDATTGDLEFQAAAYLKQPERSLTQETQGTFDAFTYGSSLFFQFLDEREGQDSLRELWEQLAADGGSDWLSSLDHVLQAHDSSLSAAFAEFVEENLYTGSRADPDHGYAQGSDLPLVTERQLDVSLSEEMVRVFPLAARYYALKADAAEQLSAAALLADADGLELLLAREHAGKIDRVQHADRAGKLLSAALQLEAGDVLHAVVYNTRKDGSSLRPDLCIGSVANVATCRAAHGDSSAQVAKSAAGSGGCSAAGGHAGADAWAAPALLLVCFRRRKQRSARADHGR